MQPIKTAAGVHYVSQTDQRSDLEEKKLSSKNVMWSTQPNRRT